MRSEVLVRQNCGAIWDACLLDGLRLYLLIFLFVPLDESEWRWHTHPVIVLEHLVLAVILRHGANLCDRLLHVEPTKQR